MNILKVLTKKRIVGNIGEKEAARLLKREKYKILKKNYVALGHEIDIIAKKDNERVFVEVKTRSIEKMSDFEARPASAVTQKKQADIITVASHFHKTYDERFRMRFDVIEVILKNNKPHSSNHMVAAFNKNTAYRR